jgi:hypothetical protein
LTSPYLLPRVSYGSRFADSPSCWGFRDFVEANAHSRCGGWRVQLKAGYPTNDVIERIVMGEARRVDGPVTNEEATRQRS